MVGAVFATVTSGLSATPAGTFTNASDVSVTVSLPSGRAGAFHSPPAFFFCAAPAGSGVKGNVAIAAHVAAEQSTRERLRRMTLTPKESRRTPHPAAKRRRPL